MKPASSYPVYFGYKATADPYYTAYKYQSSNPSLWVGSYHKGNDYGTPMGTPVDVNGVVIGRTGASGRVSGPHIHVQLYPEQNPTGKEWNVPGAKVIATGYDQLGGYYIKLQGSDGITRYYGHLSSIDVTNGQLIGGKVKLTKEQIISVYTGFFDVEDSEVPSEFIKAYEGSENLDGLLTQLKNDPTWKARKALIQQMFKNPDGAVLQPGKYIVK